jgi:hypothetical protein
MVLGGTTRYPFLLGPENAGDASQALGKGKYGPASKDAQIASWRCSRATAFAAQRCPHLGTASGGAVKWYAGTTVGTSGGSHLMARLPHSDNLAAEIGPAMGVGEE